MKENRSNSREGRRAPLYHGRSVDRPVNSYDFNNRGYELTQGNGPDDHPMVCRNPLGVAFGYVALPLIARRVN